MAQYIVNLNLQKESWAETICTGFYNIVFSMRKKAGTEHSVPAAFFISRRSLRQQ